MKYSISVLTFFSLKLISKVKTTHWKKIKIHNFTNIRTACFNNFKTTLFFSPTYNVSQANLPFYQGTQWLRQIIIFKYCLYSENFWPFIPKTFFMVIYWLS